MVLLPTLGSPTIPTSNAMSSHDPSVLMLWNARPFQHAAREPRIIPKFPSNVRASTGYAQHQIHAGLGASGDDPDSRVPAGNMSPPPASKSLMRRRLRTT